MAERAIRRCYQVVAPRLSWECWVSVRCLVCFLRVGLDPAAEADGSLPAGLTAALGGTYPSGSPALLSRVRGIWIRLQDGRGWGVPHLSPGDISPCWSFPSRRYTMVRML